MTGRFGTSTVGATVELLQPALGAIADAMTAAVLADVPAYRTLTSEAVDSYRGVLAHAMEVFLATAVSPSSDRLPAEEGRWLRALGAERARAGFPLQVVLDGTRVAMRVGWRQLMATLEGSAEPAHRAQAIIELPVALVRFVAEVEDALVAGYAEGLAEQERGRTDLLHELLAGPFENEAGFSARAATYGLHLTGDHTLMLLTSDGGHAEVERAGAALRAGLPQAWTTSTLLSDPPHLVALMPCAPETSKDAIDDSAREVLAKVVAENDVTALIIGRVSELSAAHQAYRRAIDLTRVAVALSPRAVVTADELVAIRCLDAVPEVLLREFVQVTLGPVLELATRRRKALIDALWALHRHGSHAAAAKALGVHVHTVRNERLRIHHATGLDFERQPDRFRLEMALYALQLLNGTRPGPGSPSESPPA